MKHFFYTLLIIISRTTGWWFFQISAGFIAAGYFFFFPRRVRTGIDFYRALYPGHTLLFYLGCVFRQYLNFTTVFMDRFLMTEKKNITYVSQGIEHLEAAVRNKTGGIILMSHMGNWEIAAHLLKQDLANLELMLYMGRRQKEQIEASQKQQLRQSGIRIAAIDPNGASPFDLVEGLEFIRQGGLVAMTGDRIWHERQRRLEVTFLGHHARIPEAPFLFALLTGAPVFVFFAMRSGPRHYRFSTSKPIWVRAPSRQDRAGAITASAQAYSDEMQAVLKTYPFQWYHFEPFLQTSQTAGHQYSWKAPMEN